MVLYGITATLWAYCVSLFMPSPLASFAVAAGSQVIMFLVCVPEVTASPHSRKHGQVYLIGYLVTFTYAQSSKADVIANKIRELIDGRISLIDID